MAESPWLADVRKALGARPDICMWRQHAGDFHPPNNPKIWVTVAPPGIADLMGVQLRRVSSDNISVMETVNPNSMQPLERPIEWFYGQAIAIETKARNKKQRQTQLDFEHAFRSAGGVYIVAHEDQWEVLWAGLGREPDPLVAERYREIWQAIERERAPVRVA